MPSLTVHVIQSRMHEIQGWKNGKSQIYRKFIFPGFAECIAFVDGIAKRAIAVNHHPDIDIRYNKATIRLSTHVEGGVTNKDIRLAADINKMHAGHELV
jgi:4a-hydroxytetrahydrobiopterin dehydratase